MFDDFFEQAGDLTRRGVPFATATVVRAEKPTSGKPGDRAIVTLDGVMSGWIGGSCAQPTVIREARQAILDDQSRLIRLSTEAEDGAVREGVVERTMTCFSGGTLEIFIEPHPPRPRLLIVGNLPVARALAQLGKAMSYHVLAVVPPEDSPEGIDDGAAMAHADEVLHDFDAIADRVTPLTFAVIASHGHYDEQALRAVLATPVPYVGLVASRKRAAALIDELRRGGLSETALNRLEAPAGLDIGARRGDEIALSIMAEVIQARRGAERFAWSSNATADAAAELPSAEVVAAGCCGSPESAAEGPDSAEDTDEPEPNPNHDTSTEAATGGCCGGGS